MVGESLKAGEVAVTTSLDGPSDKLLALICNLAVETSLDGPSDDLLAFTACSLAVETSLFIALFCLLGETAYDGEVAVITSLDGPFD